MFKLLHRFLFFIACSNLGLSAFADGVIEKIIVQPKDQEALVLSSVPFQIGDSFDSKLIEISKRLLMSTERFERADLMWSSNDSTMQVKVVPKLYFEDPIWKGDQLSQVSELRQQCLISYESRSITQERISEITQCLLRGIRGRGYLDAQLALDTRSEELVIDLHLGSLYLTSEISFVGNEHLSDEMLQEHLTNRKGSPFLGSQIDQDTKALLKAYFDDGFYFAEVFKPAIQVDPKAKTVQISWKIHESYPIEVTFTGQRKSRKRLYQFMEREQTFPAWFVDEIVDEMTAELKEDAYLTPEIKVTKGINARGIEAIDINTRTGPRFHLLNPELVGVGDRNECMKLYNSVSDLQEGERFEEENYRRALSDVFVNLLMSHGYLDAHIRSLDFVIDKEKALVQPVIYLNEGDLYSIRSSSLEGLPKAYRNLQEAKDLMNSIRMAEPYDSILVEKHRLELQRRLVTLGFLDAKVEQKIEKSDAKIALQIAVTPGPRYRVAKVLIRGAIKTKYEVLKREVLISSGDFYEDEAVKDSVAQILRLGIARSVDIQVLEKDPKRGEVYVLVDVKEAARFRIEIGPGYGTIDGLRGVLKATYANIGGTARRLSLYAKASRRLGDSSLPDEKLYLKPGEVPFVQRRISVEYFEPSLFQFPVDGRLSYTHSKEETSRFGLKNSFMGAIDYRLSRHWIFTSDYELAFSDPFNVLKSNSKPGDDASKRFTNVGEIVLIDYLNDSFNPTKGSRLRLEGDLYDSHLGGEENFWQTSVRYEYFLPLWVIRKGKMLGFALNSGLGFSESYSPSTEVPFEKRSEIGGETTVRGYGFRAINPKGPFGLERDGGNSYFYFQTELNIPLFYGIDLLGFFDGGNAYFTNKDFHPWSLRYGAGPGIRWNTPVGPLKFGYGFALFRKPGEAIGHVYIGVGAI